MYYYNRGFSVSLWSQMLHSWIHGMIGRYDETISLWYEFKTGFTGLNPNVDSGQPWDAIRKKNILEQWLWSDESSKCGLKLEDLDRTIWKCWYIDMQYSWLMTMFQRKDVELWYVDLLMKRLAGIPQVQSQAYAKHDNTLSSICCLSLFLFATSDFNRS